MSFVLRFTDTSEAASDPPVWRGALEEVTTGARKAVLSYEALVSGLAEHGVALDHEKPRPAVCSACRDASVKAKARR